MLFFFKYINKYLFIIHSNRLKCLNSFLYFNTGLFFRTDGNGSLGFPEIFGWPTLFCNGV